MYYFISVFFHAIISPDYRFFLEVPPFEEVQDPDSSPRREEVGRRTLGDYGGFLPPFFLSGEVSIVHTSTARKRQARKIYPNKTPITSGVEESLHRSCRAVRGEVDSSTPRVFGGLLVVVSETPENSSVNN